MELQIIKTDREYNELLEWVDNQFDLDIAPDSKEGGNLQITNINGLKCCERKNKVLIQQQFAINHCWLGNIYRELVLFG